MTFPTSPEIFCPTFDDGPDPVWTPQILDVLRESSARATFFVVTPLALSHREILERAISEGYEIALHCRKHTRHTELTEEEILADTGRGIEDLAGIGVEPSCWRPPWGVVTSGTKRAAREFGLRIELWNSDTHDWRGDDAGVMLDSVLPGLGGGCVVLMHDGIGPGATRTDCRETLSLVSRLVSAAGEHSVEAGTLSELREAESEIAGNGPKDGGAPSPGSQTLEMRR